MSRWYPDYSRLFNSVTEATLASMSAGGVRSITLDAIMHEIKAEGSGKKPLP